MSDEVNQLELHFADDVLANDEILDLTMSHTIKGNLASLTSVVTVSPNSSSQWDYHAKAVLHGPEGVMQTGLCTSSTIEQNGTVRLIIEGINWELDRAWIKGIETFGMSAQEYLYWSTLLTGLVAGVEIPDLELNEDLRPFLYAVPLKGLTAEGKLKSFSFQDLLVVSGESDNVFSPLVANSNLVKTEPVWQDNVPKASGVVFAHGFMEAENLALDRAQFTADVINFALSSGISHFQTRYDNEFLEWDADVGRSIVSLEPWVLLREASTIKGWIRSIPLIQHEAASDINDKYDRIRMFVDSFSGFSSAGNVREQVGQRVLSRRERKLSAGVQSSLRWIAVASKEENLADQFIASWIALEAVLNAMEYPGVFDGDRRAIRESLEGMLESVNLPDFSDDLLTIPHGLIRERLLQNQWPLSRKLALYAEAFGVKLKPGDVDFVRFVGRQRNRVLHTGRNDIPVTKEQVRKLKYLVERLIVAGSVFGYQDIEDQAPYQFKFGEIGPEGGGAPLFLHGREVPYEFRLFAHEGEQVAEFIVEGKIYVQQNINISSVSP